MRAFDWVYTIGFCALIGSVPALVAAGIGVQRDAEFAESERRPRRVLAAPALDRGGMARFLASVEGWACDRMPFRGGLVRARASMMGALDMPLNPDAVVVGEDGWMFFGDGVGRGLAQYRGLVTLDGAQLSALQAYFSSVREAAAQAGIPCIIAIAPDKHAIYPEFLPRHLAGRGTGPADQLMSDAAGLDLLDLRPVLLEAKSSSGLPLYYRNDSHWNEFGAYLAYRAVMARIPGARPVEASEGDFRALPPHRGDVGRMAGPALDRDCENAYIRRDFFPGRLQVEDRWKGESLSLPAAEMTSVSHFRSIAVTGSGREGTVLLIGDSFLDNASRYFNNSFGCAVYQHYTEFGDRTVAELLREWRPRALVFEIVQRNLILPTSRFIPASADRAASGHAAHAAVVLPALSLVSAGGAVRDLRDARTDGGDAVLDATGFDPYLVLPPVRPMPAGATVVLELTLPAERLVQLYYQTVDAASFSEERSVRSALSGGRHRIEWRIDAPLNGVFRLDPGNAPGEYRVHRVEFRP
jgi:alginate O-acetyltransferase complex protein AlgJ